MGTQSRLNGWKPKGKEYQEGSRRQSKPEPCCEAARDSCTGDTQRETYLATSRAGKGLAKGHQVGKGTLVHPSSPLDNLLTVET
jgi:hypothetical protein